MGILWAHTGAVGCIVLRTCRDPGDKAVIVDAWYCEPKLAEGLLCGCGWGPLHVGRWGGVQYILQWYGGTRTHVHM